MKKTHMHQFPIAAPDFVGNASPWHLLSWASIACIRVKHLKTSRADLLTTYRACDHALCDQEKSKPVLCVEKTEFLSMSLPRGHFFGKFLPCVLPRFSFFVHTRVHSHHDLPCLRA